MRLYMYSSPLENTEETGNGACLLKKCSRLVVRETGLKSWFLFLLYITLFCPFSFIMCWYDFFQKSI